MPSLLVLVVMVFGFRLCALSIPFLLLLLPLMFWQGQVSLTSSSSLSWPPVAASVSVLIVHQPHQRPLANSTLKWLLCAFPHALAGNP